MDSIILKKGFNCSKLINDLKIATNSISFINPELINHKTFSLSDKTFGWEALPLHTINGQHNIDSATPKDVKLFNNFKPNKILEKCKYIKEILDNLNTEIYLVRIMKLRSGGFIAPHIDKLINKDYIIRCQLPIITNNKIDFIINGKKHNLIAGNLYFLNVEKEHYVKNNSNQDRYTLIIDMKPTDEIKRILSNCVV